jgi:regulator of protease activity HflC (stomatin/prohibitin superfamily)
VSQRDENRIAEEAPGLSLLSGIVLFCVGLAMFCIVRLRAGLDMPLGRLLYQLSAVFFVTAAVFLSVALTARARKLKPQERKRFTTRGSKPWPFTLERLRPRYAALRTSLANIDWVGDWLPLFAAAAPSLLALYALSKAWTIAGPEPSAPSDQWLAALLTITAFATLVYERHFAQMPEWRLPEAASIARILRLPILVFLLLAIAAIVRWLALSWWPLLEHVVDIIVGLVALELVLRSFAYLFIPLAPVQTRRSHADSFLAGLIRPQWPDLEAINKTINEKFGIDFARSWALSFLRRATVPMLLAMVLLCWLLTGVTALGLNQRAVYEAFGRPQAVFTSGLHVHLPWPFGVLRPVEYGVVHEIPILFSAAGNVMVEAGRQPAQAASIEGEPPPSADRLWTADHPSEASYLVASIANGKQSFEVADIDLRIVYRIGLSDAAARDVVYNVASPDSVIRATAGRMLARYFARYTMADVLGQNRDAFIRGFERELQARLASLDTGIQIMAVVVEAIHPPSDAAASYQGVQAAAIRAQVAIATAKGDAISRTSDAQQQAIRARNEAAGQAAERIDQAKAALSLFNGDHQAYLAGGDAFLFERRLEHLGKGLGILPLVIIDHRISHDDALTLDLRPLSAGASNYVPEEP